MSSKAQNKRLIQRRNRRVLNASPEFIGKITGYRLGQWSYKAGLHGSDVNDVATQYPTGFRFFKPTTPCTVEGCYCHEYDDDDEWPEKFEERNPRW